MKKTVLSIMAAVGCLMAGAIPPATNTENAPANITTVSPSSNTEAPKTPKMANMSNPDDPNSNVMVIDTYDEDPNDVLTDAQEDANFMQNLKNDPNVNSFQKVEDYELEGSNHQWLSNPWKDNWFIFANVGANAYWGDKTYGSLGTRLTPQFTVGIGKWFLPGLGIKLQASGFQSRAHKYMEGYFTHWSDKHYDANGDAYWIEKHNWWDVSINAMFNLSRIICGYEGRNQHKLMNQFIFTIGIGANHTTNIYDGGTQNEWSGHAELQYSRFFTAAKRFSLNVILRGMFFDTWWDQVLHHQHFDSNVSLNVGLTYYLGERGWRKLTRRYVSYYQKVENVIVNQEVAANETEYKKIVFYIFYPNNYSGRNDAPVVGSSTVNAIDYLAGGTFCQRRFTNNSQVESALGNEAALRRLATENIPTRRATFTNNPAGDAHGYEMSTMPISLSMDPTDMLDYEKITDHFYAPIYSSENTWYYRVDDDTKSQRLMDPANYKETKSYQLNAHQGLDLINRYLRTDWEADLYSFADFYAAVYGNAGYISNFVDPVSVAEIQDILKNARLTTVQVEGIATSQDNYIGPDAESVGNVRNRNLSHYRAFTAVKWLKNTGLFDALDDNDFSINILPAIIGEVTDHSTRDLPAKLSRGARVTIRYLREVPVPNTTDDDLEDLINNSRPYDKSRGQ